MEVTNDNSRIRLVAFWVKGHFFLETFFVNLGGRFLYKFDESEGSVNISRRENDKYVDSFYSDINPNLGLVSGLVGKNGAGKSTIIDIIRQSVKSGIFHRITFEYSILIFEDEVSHNVLIREFNPERRMGTGLQVFGRNQATLNVTYEMPVIEGVFVPETILYSPFLDLKEKFFNSANSSDIDLSLDRVIQQDIEKNSSKDRNDFLLDHRYESVFRQMDFLSSGLAADLNKIFDIPFFTEMNVFIGGPAFIPSDANNNIPFAFRPFHKKLYDIWSDKIYDTERQITNDLAENRRIVKLWFLRELIASLFAPQDSTNSFLDEGKVKVSSDDLNELSLKEALFCFLDNHYFEKYENLSLPTEEIKYLVELSFDIIDDLERHDFLETQKLNLSFDKCQKILKAHKAFVLKLRETYNRSVGFIDFTPDIELSSGEKSILNLYSRFYAGIEEIDRRRVSTRGINYNDRFPNHFILLLDEGDLGLQPVWKKKYLKNITEILPKFFEKYNVTVQVIFTSHDPLVLSDIPNYNITYLDQVEGKYRVMSYGFDGNRPDKCFGANISDLLSDSFFIDNGLVGELAVKKIDHTIEWLDDPESKDNQGYHKKIIELIDEPILQKQLVRMYTKKTGEASLELDVINKAIQELEERRKKLNDGGN